MYSLFQKKEIFILGTDHKSILRDAIEPSRHYYFDPESRSIPWNFKIIADALYYLIKLISLDVPLRSKIKSAYLTSLIDNTSQEIAITAIDNNIHFYRAARILDKSLRFIIIQNGIKLYSRATNHII